MNEWTFLPELTVGFGRTVMLFSLTLIISLPLGLLVYAGRVAAFKPLNWLVQLYISIMRGTPLIDRKSVV